MVYIRVLHEVPLHSHVHAMAKTPFLKDRRLSHLQHFMFKRAQDKYYIVDRGVHTRAFQAPSGTGGGRPFFVVE